MDKPIEERFKIGEKIITLLNLREDKKEKWNPKRYITSYGNKTALGIYETLKSIIEN